jgi:hypothetical protein
MSPVISNDPTWNEEWHEELLTISLLEKGPLQREELKKRIRSIQKAKSARFKPHLPKKYHKYRNYDRWIRKLIERELIEEHDRVLRLTGLGEWITKSKLGSLSERDSFLESFICKKCSRLPNIVLLTPLKDTINVNTINAKGQIWVDLRCRKCKIVDTHGLSFSKDKLVKFYSQAVVELKQFVNLEAQGI